MKKITKPIFFITAISFILFLNGKKWLPSIFNHLSIQWILVALLVLLASIGFITSLSLLYSSDVVKFSKKLEPIYYLFVFCFVIISLSMPHIIILTMYDLGSFSVTHETNILDCLSNSMKNEKMRKNAAQMIYWDIGKKIPYLKDSGEYILYTPSDMDISKAKENNIQKEQIRKLQRNVVKSSKNNLIIQFAGISGFFIATSIAILVLFRGKNIINYQNIKR